ncbi:hypothetical protein [Streptomyces sp. NPDC088725]|uniref:hypothetical protein n=1 Tax=Streptomyces sp. NPDC088725 TaxID=3365873 RepID=UPI00381DA17E
MGPRAESARELALWCADRLDAVFGVRAEARRGKLALVLVRPDGHVDRIARDVPSMRARLTALFGPVLGARRDEQEKVKEHTV